MPANRVAPIQWFSRNARKQPSRSRRRISVQCQTAWPAATPRYFPGAGVVKSAFTVSGVGVTKGAREAIEKAGGKVVEASA